MKKYFSALICAIACMICMASTAMAEGYPSSGADIPEGSALLNEQIIGEEVGYGGNIYQGCLAAFDGQASTCYNPSALGAQTAYCGVALSEAHVLTQVCVLPRAGWAQRLEGAVIQGSNDLDEWHTLYQFENVPAEVQWHIITEFAQEVSYRYFRYHNPQMHGDVAEVEFYGHPGEAAVHQSADFAPSAGSELLCGTPIGAEQGWGRTAHNGRAAAFDGSIQTSYQAATTGMDGSWCGLALDQRHVLTQLRLFPRNGWASRVQSACLQGSFDQENWTTLYQFMEPVKENEWVVVDDFFGNIGYSYYRYINVDGIGDVAEIELYGYAGNLGDDPNNYTITMDVSALRVTLETGEGEPAQMTVCFGAPYEGLPKLADREGERFMGWYTSQEGGTRIDENTVVTRLRHHTLYARWD